MSSQDKIRDSVERILKHKLPDGALQERLKELRLPPNFCNALTLALLGQACDGNVQAAKLVISLTEGEEKETLGNARNLSELSEAQLMALLQEDQAIMTKDN